MHPFVCFLLVAPVLALCAPNRPDSHCREDNRYGDKHDDHDYCHGKPHRSSSCGPPTQTSSTPPTSTSCAPFTDPTKAYTVMASSPGTPIDLLSIEAGGLGFRLGGGTGSYCPTFVGPSCPPGNQTVFFGSGISVMVPGGQQQYFEPGGRVGYTQAHSLYMPTGSLPGGFSYYKCPNEQYGHITTTVFGATGLMACPDSSTGIQVYVLYAKIPNAVVPSGNVQDCISFDGLTSDYNGPLPAAWQYV
jgi:hypothetical protein